MFPIEDFTVDEVVHVVVCDDDQLRPLALTPGRGIQVGLVVLVQVQARALVGQPVLWTRVANCQVGTQKPPSLLIPAGPNQGGVFLVLVESFFSKCDTER